MLDHLGVARADRSEGVRGADAGPRLRIRLVQEPEGGAGGSVADPRDLAGRDARELTEADVRLQQRDVREHELHGLEVQGAQLLRRGIRGRRLQDLDLDVERALVEVAPVGVEDLLRVLCRCRDRGDAQRRDDADEPSHRRVPPHSRSTEDSSSAGSAVGMSGFRRWRCRGLRARLPAGRDRLALAEQVEHVDEDPVRHRGARLRGLDVQQGPVLLLVVVQALDHPADDDRGVAEGELDLHGQPDLGLAADEDCDTALGEVHHPAAQAAGRFGRLVGLRDGTQREELGRQVGLDAHVLALLRAHEVVAVGDVEDRVLAVGVVVDHPGLEEVAGVLGPPEVHADLLGLPREPVGQAGTAGVLDRHVPDLVLDQPGGERTRARQRDPDHLALHQLPRALETQLVLGQVELHLFPEFEQLRQQEVVLGALFLAARPVLDDEALDRHGPAA